MALRRPCRHFNRLRRLRRISKQSRQTLLNNCKGDGKCWWQECDGCFRAIKEAADLVAGASSKLETGDES